MSAKTDYTRAELISICERAIVDCSIWSDRDSSAAMDNVGIIWANLRAGCHFEVKDNALDSCCSDDETIWIQFWIRDFNWFESFGDERSSKGNKSIDHHGYLPTPQRLDRCSDKDWY